MLKCSNHNHECRWRRRKEARPEEILEAALKLFTEKGFTSARMIDIAREAGISKGTLYLYFDSKEAVFIALVKTIISPKVDQAETAVNEFKGNRSDLLREFIRGWWQEIWYTDLSAMPKIILAEAGNFPEIAEFYVENILKRIRGMLEKVIISGIENGEFKKVDARSTARIIMAPVIQANIWKHSLAPYDDEFEAESYINHHIEILLSGLQKENT